MRKTNLLILLCCLALAGCNAQKVPEAPRPSESPVTVYPLPETLDIAALDNCMVAVSLKEGDVDADENDVFRMKLTVYTYELYDMVDVAALKEGDALNINGNAVLIAGLERRDNGDVIINGGLDVGGFVLRTDNSGVYYEIGYNDAKSYKALGEIQLSLSPDFIFVDGSDLDNEPVSYTAENFLDPDSHIAYYFFPSNTNVVVENGQIVTMERRYIP